MIGRLQHGAGLRAGLVIGGGNGIGAGVHRGLRIVDRNSHQLRASGFSRAMPVALPEERHHDVDKGRARAFSGPAEFYVSLHLICRFAPQGWIVTPTAPDLT
ncbi:hypothetical protein MASR2M74_16380 [Paracoccaceae bacterium]